MKQFKIKRLFAGVMCLVLLTGLMAGCEKKAEVPASASSASSSETSTSQSAQSGKEVVGTSLSGLAKPRLVSGTGDDGAGSYTVSVEDYKVDDDFSNVLFADQLQYESEEMREKLKNNLFVVSGEAGMEFFQLYEFNRYTQRPSFITVDSLLHTYHLEFMKLLKDSEKGYLCDILKNMTDKLYDRSLKDYDIYKGSDWESAALRNAEYFAVAKILLGGDASNLPAEAKEAVTSEVTKIGEAATIAESAICNKNEDYTQYKVRGYYEGDEILEKYFKTMMWYGRITFPTDTDDMQRSALLLTLAVNDVAASEWSAIYAVTSFFAGNSDDNGVSEYIPCIVSAYGEQVSSDDLKNKKDAFVTYLDAVKKLPAPAVNSIPVQTDENNVVQGFRLMGQRFTIDAYIMQNLVYRAVDMNEAGEARMLPDVLDVPAAFGSGKAFELALKEGADKFPGYTENMKKLQGIVSGIDPAMWNESLYAGWINAILPVFGEKGDGYPSFMKSPEWALKNLESFAGSFTELKHDTVLYSKPVMAEMGGGWEEEIDFRGYVEPEPVIYARIYNLTKAMADGLKGFNVISDADVESLNSLMEISDTLRNISIAELKGETLSDEQYNFIEEYGGYIEHIWYQVYADESTPSVDVGEHPASLVVDIATDPNGAVLELANGEPSVIYAVVPVDGTLRIARGVVFNFYQFTMPLDKRLTDNEWGHMIGTVPTEGADGYPEYHKSDDIPEKPDWTMSYRAK